MFSNERIIDLLSNHFIPVTNNVSFSQRQQDEEGEFFRKIAEQGHYAGRTFPSDTRQGLYIAAPDGELIESINTTNKDRLFRMLQSALQKWGERESASDAIVPRQFQPDKRYAYTFPEDGLILQALIRDLPRKQNDAARDSRHNLDYVWLTRSEKLSLIPESIQVGQSTELSDEIVQRFARYHLLDHVRGEAPPWKKEHVHHAKLQTEITAVTDKKISLRMTGVAKMVRPPTGRVNPYTNYRIDSDCGLDLQLEGYLEFDRTQEQFTRFDLLATGQRWGTTMYNFRNDDLEPQPIGIAFHRLPPKPQNKVPPKFIVWGYFDE